MTVKPADIPPFSIPITPAVLTPVQPPPGEPPVAAPPIVVVSAPAPAPAPAVVVAPVAPPAPVVAPSPVTPPVPPPAVDPIAEARAAGARAATDALLAPLLAAGYPSLEAFIAAVSPPRTEGSTVTIAPGQPGYVPPAIVPPAAAPAPAPVVAPVVAPAPAPPARQLTAEQRADARVVRETIAAREAEVVAANARASQVQTEANAQLVAQQQRARLGYTLARAGVEDPDYVLNMYEQHRTTLDDAGRADLDAPAVPAKAAEGDKPAVAAKASGWDRWVESLKTGKPYLFGQPPSPPTVSVPANTGAPGTPPAAPTPGATTTVVGAGAKVDYRTMTPTQRADYDKRAGLRS